GAQKVVPNYNVMGPVKAALEASCRYLAYELGPKNIRVHAISPGPVKTRAASGLRDFDLLLNEAGQRAPLGNLVDIMDVGFTCAIRTRPRSASIVTTERTASSDMPRRLASSASVSRPPAAASTLSVASSMSRHQLSIRLSAPRPSRYPARRRCRAWQAQSGATGAA